MRSTPPLLESLRLTLRKSRIVAVEHPGSGLELAVFEQTNAERVKSGVGLVRWDNALAMVARRHAWDMAQRRFFGHVDPGGGGLQDRMASYRWRYCAIGENLAAGQATPREAVDAWLGSPGHRANLLRPAFDELGVAALSTHERGVIWVQVYGRRC